MSSHRYLGNSVAGASAGRSRVPIPLYVSGSEYPIFAEQGILWIRRCTDPNPRQLAPSQASMLLVRIEGTSEYWAVAHRFEETTDTPYVLETTAYHAAGLTNTLCAFQREWAAGERHPHRQSSWASLIRFHALRVVGPRRKLMPAYA